MSIVLVWFFVTLLLAFAGLVLGVMTFEQSTWGRRVAWLLGGAICCVVGISTNPVPMLAFAPLAEKWDAEMMADARKANCVGQSSDWLVARYGRPDETDHIGTVRHWWYAAGPPFPLIMRDEYVGFTVENGIVTSIYLRVD